MNFVMGLSSYWLRHGLSKQQEPEPGPVGSHKTALKKFLNVPELALDREFFLLHAPHWKMA
jgi:hypothetical protein